MGLTIGYTFSTRRKLDLGGIKQLLTPLRAKARTLGFDEVGGWVKLGPDCEFIRYKPPGARRFADCLPPLEGWLFHATPGDGCESARIGLCRFAGVPGWRLESFCKTQYASRHGWEHFLHCHRGVVELLWEAEKLGIKVRAHDEGELWETGSHKRLKQILGEYNECIAAFTGALKDALDTPVGETEAPILQHPDFEQLEAKGLIAHGPQISQAVKIVEHLSSSANQ